jgi:hypothetical protein
MQRYTVYLYMETALHVEQFPDINKLCNVSSCWIYIAILLGAHPILHISRIKVNTQKNLNFILRFNKLFFSVVNNENAL